MIKIAIIERIEDWEDDKPFNINFFLGTKYKEIFDELGILLIPVISEKYLDEICNMCDALIVTGSSNDVHPKYYNEEPIKGKEYKIDEYGLVKNIVQIFSNANKPILGICAGIQEINVIFGGTLNQKIPNHNLRDQSKHRIKLSQDSFLCEVYKSDTIEVNSYHQQSVKDLAPNFKITAISEDGIVEGIEKNNIVAVQWHPETLHDIKFFDGFIKKYINCEI